MKIVLQYRSPSFVRFLSLSTIILLLFIAQTLIVSAAPANLISNPSLETVSSDPTLPQDWVRGGWGTNTRVFTYPAIGYDGAKAVKVEITSYTNGDAKWYFKEVPVTPGQTYTFSNNYISSAPSFISARFKMTNGTFTYFDLPQVPASPTSWKSLQGNITVPANVTSMTVFHVIKQVGYLTTDNFSLVSASTTPPPPPPPPTSVNLIQNPTFETLGANGDPVGWLRGGYGQNTRSFGVIPCTYYTEEDQLKSDREIINYYDTVHRPGCPPNAKYRLVTNVSNYIDGNAKWYFSDVPIGTNKKFRLSFQYQAYTCPLSTQITVRYTLPGGIFQYVPIGVMTPLKQGGMGYVGWVYTEHDFIAPTNATALTVFFSVEGRTPCIASGQGTLSIANPVLRLQQPSDLPPAGADITPPTATIISPTASTTVSGIITVSVAVTDNVRVGAVRLYVDDAPSVADSIPIGSIDTIAPYNFSWDTTTLTDGPHKLIVRTVDGGSNIGGYDTSPIIVTVSNSTSTPPPPPTDTTPPMVSITTPGAGATVSGTSAVVLSVFDNINIQDVTFLVDGNTVSAGCPPPVSSGSGTRCYSWNTAGMLNGPHILTARATDTAGNIGTSTPITVTVANIVPPPPPPPAPTNLIPNPSFETPGVGGDPANWIRKVWGTNVSTFTYSSIGADSNKAAKIEITSYTNGDAKWRFNDIPVVGGRTYTFNNSYKSTVATELGAWYQTPAGKQYQVLTSLPASPTWVPVTRQINVPANATMLSVTQAIYRVGTLEVDGFSLTQNP